MERKPIELGPVPDDPTPLQRNSSPGNQPEPTIEQYCRFWESTWSISDFPGQSSIKNSKLPKQPIEQSDPASPNSRTSSVIPTLDQERQFYRLLKGQIEAPGPIDRFFTGSIRQQELKIFQGGRWEPYEHIGVSEWFWYTLFELKQYQWLLGQFTIKPNG